MKILFYILKKDLRIAQNYYLRILGMHKDEIS